MILKNILLIASLLNPFNIIQINPNKDMKFLVNNPKLIAMAPQGAHISREATNKINPPGCSVNITSTNKSDGSIETRETLTCTTVTTESASGKKTVRPSNSSKQKEKDEKKIEEYRKKYIK